MIQTVDILICRQLPRLESDIKVDQDKVCDFVGWWGHLYLSSSNVPLNDRNKFDSIVIAECSSV